VSSIISIILEKETKIIEDLYTERTVLLKYLKFYIFLFCWIHKSVARILKLFVYYF